MASEAQIEKPYARTKCKHEKQTYYYLLNIR